MRSTRAPLFVCSLARFLLPSRLSPPRALPRKSVEAPEQNTTRLFPRSLLPILPAASPLDLLNAPHERKPVVEPLAFPGGGGGGGRGLQGSNPLLGPVFQGSKFGGGLGGGPLDLI